MSGRWKRWFERPQGPHSHGQAHDPDLAALLREARGLPRDVPPPHDLWPGVARRLERRPALWRLGRWAPAAVALALAVAAGLLLPRRTSEVTPGPDAQPAALGSRAAALDAALLGDDLRLFRVAVERALARRRDELPPEALAAVEENLEIIERAAGEICRALAENPDDPGLNLLLAAAYGKELDLLHRLETMGAKL